METFTRKFKFGDIDLPDKIRSKLSSDINQDSVVMRKGFSQKDSLFVDGERAAIYVITSATLDRDSEIVIPKGLDFKNFDRAGKPVLWAHKYDELSLGHCQWVRYDQNTNTVLAKAVFGKHPKADMIYEHIKEFPLSCSIGFIPKKWVDKEDFGDIDWKSFGVNESELSQARRVFLETEMLELSLCPVPSNPAACQVAVAKALITMDDLKQVGGYPYEIIDPFKKETPHEQIETEEKTVAEEEQESGTNSDGQQEEQKEVVTKPDTDNYIHIGVSGQEGQHSNHKIRTMAITEGIQAHYCVDCKKITGYLFDSSKFTHEEAQQWVDDHKKGFDGLSIDLLLELEKFGDIPIPNTETEAKALRCTCKECGESFQVEGESCPTACPACSKEDEDKPEEVEEDACGGKPKKPKKDEEPEEIKGIEIEDLPIAMSKSIKDENKAERWNKSLSKTFDIQNVPSQPANYTMKIFCQFLECKVKNIYQNDFFIPSPMIGSYLAGFKACSKDFVLKDTRAFSKYEQLEFPPVYEVIRINSKTQDDFLVDGSAFYDFEGEPIILDFSPNYWGLNASVFTSRKNMSLSKEFMSAVHNWVENENPLKDEKMALTGEFLETDPNDTWDTIVLNEKNLAAGKLAEKLINEKEMDFSGRGMLLLGTFGTGKTKLARILMTQTKHTFLWVSSKDLTQTPYPEDKIALGFKLARQLAPCILCLEDIDNWISGKIVDMMKTELDGVKKNKGVITIMTTNHPEKLPGALIDRPGRFHDVLHFDVPTKDLRKEMLERWVGDIDKDLLEDVLVQTEGYSGAYMWELIEYAKSISSDEDLSIDKALQKSLEKLAGQKELIQQIRREKKEFDPGEEIIVSPKELDIEIETKDIEEVDIEIETKDVDFEIEQEAPRTIELNMDEVQSALKELVGDFLSKRPDIANLVDERIRRAQGKME